MFRGCIGWSDDGTNFPVEQPGPASVTLVPAVEVAVQFEHPIAQTLPPDILHNIFTNLLEEHDSCQALKDCSLVCHSWCLESSPFLFRHMQCSCLFPQHIAPAVRHLRILGLRLKKKPTAHDDLQVTLDTMLRSGRTLASIREFEVSGCHEKDGCLDMPTLRSVVMHMPNLRSLVLSLIRFKPMNAHQRALCVVPLHERRQLDAVVLRAHEHTRNKRAVPSIFDILRWFDIITHLDICQSGLGRIEQTSMFAPESKPVVEDLTLDETVLQAYTRGTKPSSFMNLQCLTGLSAQRLTESDTWRFNQFIKEYGRQLKHCAVSITPSYNDLLSDGTENLTLTSCSSLQSFSLAFSLCILPFSVLNTAPAARLWNDSLKTVISIPSLQELEIELRMVHFCRNLNDESCDRFLRSLAWSLLDRGQVGSESQLPPIRSIRVALWHAEGTHAFCDSPQVEGKREYLDIVVPAVLPATRNIMSFEHLPATTQSVEDMVA